MSSSKFKALKRIAMLNAISVIAVMGVLAITSPAFATVNVHAQVQLNGYSFYGNAIMDVIDQSDNCTSYESDTSGNFNIQISQPGLYDLNFRHSSGDFEWIQFTNYNLINGTNLISSNPLCLNYNPDRVIHVPADLPTIQQAIDAVQSEGWVIVTAQGEPYEVNGLHWENKHVKLLGHPGTTLTLGAGGNSHAVNLTWSGINRSDLIRGFIFQNCQINTSNAWEAYGPAITLKNGASPTIDDCSFNENSVQSQYNLEFNNPRGYGGAVFVEGGTNQTLAPYFSNCVFYDNNAGNANGGGAVALFGPAEFESCTFSWNWTTTATGFTQAAFAAGAIMIASENHSGNIIINSCTFSDNYAQCEASDIWIAKCIGIDEIQISNCEFNSNTTNYFGQPVIKIFAEFHTQQFPTELFIQGNKFNLRSCGAVYFYDVLGTSPLSFTNNVIIGQSNAQYGLSIYSRNEENQICFDNNTLRNLNASGLILFQGASYTINNNVFDNCSPYDIEWGGATSGYSATSSLTVNNCYFNDLTNHVDTNGNALQTYTANDLLVASSPQLGTNQEPIWNETVFSALIDRGVATMSDPDASPSDIGAIRAMDHNYEEYIMPYSNSSNIKWMSFPVLDRITSANTINSTFFAEIIAPSILEWVDWKSGNSLPFRMQILSTGLINGNETVTSPVGYKVQLKNNVVNEIKIPTSGHIQSPTTVMNLYKYQSGTTNLNENWLGYFQPESTTPFEAFSSVLQYLTSIQTQYWSMTKSSAGVWRTTSANPTLNYGDMVIVKVSQDCSFTWNNSQPVNPNLIKSAQNFTFTEKPEYTPLYIEFEDVTILPSEIAIYVDGICKGASVVEGADAQICVYLDSNEEIKAENSELVFWYDSKAQSENRTSCKMNSGALLQNRDFGNLCYSFVVSEKTELDPIIPLTKLSQNYPNPFNPTTTIAYELAEAGPVCIEIFNVKGQKVRTLVDKEMVAGPHRVEWNGKDKYDRPVSSGIYYYRMTSQNNSISKKMLMVK